MQAVQPEHLAVEVTVAVVGHRPVAPLLVAYRSRGKARVVVGAFEFDRRALFGELLESRIGLEIEASALRFVVFADLEFADDQGRLDLAHVVL